MSSLLSEIGGKLASGGRISTTEAAQLAVTKDILSLGMLADEIRRRRHGDRATFVRVACVNLADAPPGSVDDLPPHFGEIRIVGTLRDPHSAAAFVRMVANIAAGVPVSGFSLADMERASTGGMSLAAGCSMLRDAGLESIADAAIDELATPEQSIEAALRSGLRVPQLTVRRWAADFPAMMARAQEIQSAVGSVRAFAPLARSLTMPHPSTGYDDVKRVALARMLADNIDSIQVDWSLCGPKLAQVALTFGADDVDSVSAEGPGEAGARRAPLEEIQRNIRAASLVPVERNGRFELLEG